MISEVMIQAIGYLGVLLFVVSYQIRSNRILFLFQTLGSLTFCIQFLLLHAMSGCFNLMIIMLRDLMLAKYNDWVWVRWKGWAVILTGLSTAVLVFTWSGPLSLLPFTALVGSTAGYWTNNAQKIRLSNLVCSSPCWLIYDVLVGSWGGVLNEAITLGSILVSIRRYGWKAMGDAGSEFQK